MRFRSQITLSVPVPHLQDTNLTAVNLSNVQGMATLGHGGDASGSVLLTWHEKVTQLPL